MPTATPAFMSKTPGPVARPASSRNGSVGERPRRPHRVEVAEQQRAGAIARRDGREHRVAPRRTRPKLRRHAALAQAVANPGREPAHARGIVARAFEPHERFQIGDDPLLFGLEARQEAPRHGRQS